MLIRTLNQNLMDEDVTQIIAGSNSANSYADQVASSFDPQTYMRQLLSFMQGLGLLQRLNELFSFPLRGQALSQAYIEEAELTLGVASQMAMQVEAFN